MRINQAKKRSLGSSGSEKDAHGACGEEGKSERVQKTMIRYSPVQIPEDFDAKCADVKDRINTKAKNSDYSMNFKPPYWGQYKEYLSQGQERKCGYCELKVVAGHDGDVEHYRPKSKVNTCVKRPTEKAYVGKAVGGKYRAISHPGYWWDAYNWVNYLLSCANCNRKWKKNCFPVEGRRAKKPGQSENPLLLNPFGRKDPVNHLYFDELGAVLPVRNSKFGKTTIETCGLDRPSLTESRMQQARIAHRLAAQLMEVSESGTDEELASVVENILEAGKSEYTHAGVIRSVIKHKCSLNWVELEQIAQKLK